MLKPIVSMNQMAMNESIATTCCYVWNGNSILGSASLPHGGTLVGNKSGTKYYVNGTEMDSSWMNWTAGHVTPTYARYKVTTGVDGKWIVIDHSRSGYWENLYNDDGSLKTVIATAKVCNHSDTDRANGYCPYVKVSGSYTGKFTHTGATSAHYNLTGGNSWLVDHDAVQFSS